jgi:hypothetical protein
MDRRVRQKLTKTGFCWFLSVSGRLRPLGSGIFALMLVSSAHEKADAAGQRRPDRFSIKTNEI